MLEIANVSFQYNHSRDIISDLSLYVPDRSCVAIIGNSGCGKTTLLNLIAGLLKPNRGEITVHTDNLAYLMQDVTLLPYKTVWENALLAYFLQHKHVEESVKQQAIDMLELFQLEKDALSKFPNEISGGMKQRVGLVQVLLTDPELLLLDEPFNAVDINALGTIEAYVWDYVKRGRRTMVFITHNIEQALMLSDRIIVLGNNHVVHQVIPTNQYVNLPPSLRTNDSDYKKLFFETIEKMKL